MELNYLALVRTLKVLKIAVDFMAQIATALTGTGLPVNPEIRLLGGETWSWE